MATRLTSAAHHYLFKPSLLHTPHQDRGYTYYGYLGPSASAQGGTRAWSHQGFPRKEVRAGQDAFSRLWLTEMTRRNGNRWLTQRAGSLSMPMSGFTRERSAALRISSRARRRQRSSTTPCIVSTCSAPMALNPSSSSMVGRCQPRKVPRTLAPSR